MLTADEMVSLPDGDIGNDPKITIIVPVGEAIKPVETSHPAIRDVIDLLSEAANHSLLGSVDSARCVVEHGSILKWLCKQ